MRLYLKRALIALLFLAPVLYGIFALTSYPVEPHPYFTSGDVLVIAHRGGKGLAPENTLAAFAHSATLGGRCARNGLAPKQRRRAHRPARPAR